MDLFDCVLFRASEPQPFGLIHRSFDVLSMTHERELCVLEIRRKRIRAQ